MQLAFAAAVVPALDPVQRREQRPGRQRRPHGNHGIHEIGLWRAVADRRAQVIRGNGKDAHAG